VSFGDHLGTDQDVGLAFFPTPNYFLVRPSFACRISVHARDAGLGHKAMQCLFDLLGSDTDTRKSQITAFGTKRRGGAAKIAVMTADAFLLPVKGEGHAAIGTAQHVTAKNTLQEIRKSSPVEEDQALPRSLIILSQEHCKPIRDQSMLA
jgi:hypothetical protein